MFSMFPHRNGQSVFWSTDTQGALTGPDFSPMLLRTWALQRPRGQQPDEQGTFPSLEELLLPPSMQPTP